MENKRNGAQGTPPGVFDVLVIGAGIVGSMAARELSRYEGRIGLIDKEPSPGCGVSKAGASLIHSPLMCPPGTLKGSLCQGAPLRYKKLAAELNVGFREMDELFVALDPSQVTNLENLRRRGDSYGMTGIEMIGAEKVRELEPRISPRAVTALYVRGLLAVYPPEWALALTENARANGVEVYLGTTVTGITSNGDFGYGVHTDRGSFSTRRIINSAGLFADEIAAMVGDGIDLILTKATMAILEKSDPPLVCHTVYGSLSNTHSQLLAPTAHGNLLVGLGHFTTPRHKQDTGVSREKIEEILAMGRGLVPTLSASGIISTFAGIRSENSRASQGDFYIDHSAKAARSDPCFHRFSGPDRGPGHCGAAGQDDCRDRDGPDREGLVPKREAELVPLFGRAHGETKGDSFSGPAVRTDRLSMRAGDRGRDPGGDAERGRHARRDQTCDPGHHGVLSGRILRVAASKPPGCATEHPSRARDEEGQRIFPGPGTRGSSDCRLMIDDFRLNSI